jgi:hypothetical protein
MIYVEANAIFNVVEKADLLTYFVAFVCGFEISSPQSRGKGPSYWRHELSPQQLHELRVIGSLFLALNICREEGGGGETADECRGIRK